MKNFKQLIKELPSNRVVAAFGQFQPPTAGHEHLVKTVQTLATSADHVIYASTNEDKKHPLPADRKVYFLKRMFSEANFQQAGFKTIVEAAYELSKKYKHLTVVTFADKVAEYESQLKENNGKLYQFETIKVVSAGDIDPDNNTVSVVSGVAMCESAKKGNFTQFKKGVPHTLTELDSRRLMNDVRRGMGLEPIRETINLVKDEVREQYFHGEIFNVGDIVESAGQQYEIVKRGSNHLLVKGLDGELVSKFITDVKVHEEVKTVDSKKVGKKYKDHVTKAGSSEKAVDIAKPESGKPMSVLPKQVYNLKSQDQTDLPESVHDNRTGFRKREREDDEYHVPDPVKHTYEYTVSKEGGEKHKRTVTTGMTTNSKSDMEHHARKHLEKQGYKIHESVSTGPVVNVDKINHAGDKPHEEKFANFKGLKFKKKAIELKPTNEEAEQIDEISAKLAGNYYGAATKKHLDKVGVKPNMYDRIEKDMGKNRKTGVDRALDRVMGARKTNEEIEMIDELSTDLLARYKTAAHANAKASDAAGNYAKGDKRFKGINKATFKQFDNDLKKHGQFKEDMYSSDTRTKKVQVQDKDGNWVFKDRKFHPHKINFGASRMNGKPDPQDPAKLDTATAYQKHLDKMERQRNEAWVLNPDGKTKKKYKDIKDNKTLSISNTAPFDAFSNTNNQT
jgi:phosphopantetheine adenylyltransferase